MDVIWGSSGQESISNIDGVEDEMLISFEYDVRETVLVNDFEYFEEVFDVVVWILVDFEDVFDVVVWILIDFKVDFEEVL